MVMPSLLARVSIDTTAVLERKSSAPDRNTGPVGIRTAIGEIVASDGLFVDRFESTVVPVER